MDWPTEVQVNYLKIYFILNVLLADDAKNRTPCLELIKAVEDTDTFGRHPWGNVVWNYLLGEVRKFVEKGGEPLEQGKKKEAPSPRIRRAASGLGVRVSSFPDEHGGL